MSGRNSRLCRAPILHPFSGANALGLDQGHLPGKRTRSSNRGIITHLFNRLVCCWLESVCLVAVKELTEGGLKVVLFEARTWTSSMTVLPTQRVLVVSNVASFGGGGGAVGFREIVLALREKRPDLDVVAVYPWKGELAAECARYGIRTKIAWIPWWAFLEQWRTPRIEALITGLPRAALLLPGILQALLLFVRLRPTMVLTNTMVIPAHAIAAKLLGIPHYWMVREFGRDDHRLRFLLGYRRTIRLIGQLSESVICNSQAVQKSLLAVDPTMRTYVIYPVVDTPIGTPPERHPGEPMRVVLVGKFLSIQGATPCDRSCRYRPEGRCRHRVGTSWCRQTQTTSQACSTAGR